jgi:hypothetical protein
MITALMGWLGTLGSISAYFLLAQGRWQSTSLRYSTLNGVAGILAGAASAVYGAWPSVASNLVWVVIALHSAMNTLRLRRSGRLVVVAESRVRDRGPRSVLLNAA